MPANWAKTHTQPYVTKRRFSLYWDIVKRFWAGGPDEIRAAPLNRICTLARKMGVARVVAEDALARFEVASEIAALQQALDTVGEVKAVAITFLRKQSRKSSDLTALIIGQVILITFPTSNGPRSYVFQGVFRVPSRDGDKAVPLLNNYVLERASPVVEVAGQRLPISGACTYFCQPNGVTNSELDAAVMSAIGRGQDWPSLVNSSESATTAENLVKILSKAECASTVYSSLRASRAVLDAEIWTVISSYIESGNPVLLVLSQDGKPDRILSVIGYTLNTDEWHPGGSTVMRPPNTSWFSSSQWVDHLIVQDPSLGPYFCLSRAWLAASVAAKPEALRLSFVIATVHDERIAVSPIVAEEIAGNYLREWLRFLATEGVGKGVWWNYLVQSEEFIVLRTTLISRSDYRQHLQQLDSKARTKSLAKSTHEESTIIDDFIDSLPDDVWMCEISLPQLYVGNRTKLGEVLIATGIRDPDRSFLGARLPSQIFWRDENGEFSVARTGIDFHAPLLAAAEHKNRW